MKIKRNDKLLEFSRELRKNMTKEEKQLWYQFLSPLKKSNNISFYRQKIIGNYIVDFYCPACKLVIEVDGSQHYSEEGENADLSRDSTLAAEGIKVLRFTNLDIDKRFESCCKTVLLHLGLEV